MSETLYRGMDRDEIDRQLNLRARWPEHGEYFERWARDSAAARARLDARLDLAYGASEGQTLDLFTAAAASEPAPVLAFIHGGYWQSLDKGDFSYLAPAFVEAGIAFASLNYDLAPKVGVGEIVGQIRSALVWLARHGPGHGVDPARIFVAGHSAGGQLAVMALVTDWPALAGHGADKAGTVPADLITGLVKGACTVSGVYELEPLRLSYHQEVLGLDPETVRTMSPLRHLPDRAGPLVCAVGSEETAEFLIQQGELVAAWRGRGLAVRVVELPGRHHVSAVDALGDPPHPLFEATRALVLGAE
jgi:arylformamidase